MSSTSKTFNPFGQADLLKKAEDILINLPREIDAPAGFAQSVMERIHAEEIQLAKQGNIVPVKRASFFRDWQSWISAAALFTLVIGGSYGVYLTSNTPLSPELSKQQIVSNIEQQSELSNDAAQTPVNSTTAIQVIENTSVSVEPAKPSFSEKIDGTSRSQSSTTPAKESESQLSALVSKPPEEPKSLPISDTSPVLLSKPLIIEKSFLRYQTKNLDITLPSINEIMKNIGGKIESTSFQTAQGVQSRVVNLIIPKDQYQAFFSYLDKLGTLKEQSSESSDISIQYNESLQEMNLQKAILRDSSEDKKIAIENQIKALQKQLTFWTEMTAMRQVTIILEQETGR